MSPAESPLSSRTMTGAEPAEIQELAYIAADRSEAPPQDRLVDTMRILVCERDWREAGPRPGEFTRELRHASTHDVRSVRRQESDREVRDPSSRADN